MTLELGVAWLWDKYGKEIVDKALGAAKKEWASFRWNHAATQYHSRLKEQHSRMRVLGKPEPVSLEGIFTDVYILDRPTALRRFNIEQLKKAHEENRPLFDDVPRLNALQLAKEKDRLFILGKPGAGKTTLLSYLTLQALDNKIEKIPIFLSLHEWSNSGLGLMAFVVRQFEICTFPDARLFIEHVLNKGWAMMLFDGLDEVKAENEGRVRLTMALNDFVKQYPKNKHLITCRIAASDYAFQDFTDVEIADFDPAQVETFARKWFTDSPSKGERFLTELDKPEHRGLRELAQIPLLLALLCLAFEDTLTFPPRRNEIYEEALEALLKKWDASRIIERDDVYRALSLGRKRQLFAHIAAEYFEKGEIFFRQDDLARRVESFVARLPAAEGRESSAPDGETILKAIELQHSIFVERAHYIYSFSHLTLQEYFTARYIVDNAAKGALARLIDHHLTDPRWREVFLLTAGMLSDADAFFSLFRGAIDRLIIEDKQLIKMIKWAGDKALDYKEIGHPAVARASARATAEIGDLALDLARARALDLDRALALDLAHALALALDRAFALDLDRALAHARALALDLALDRDRASDLAFALAFARDRNHALAHALARARDRDPNEYFIGLIRVTLKASEEMDLADLNKALRGLRVPKNNAPEAQWQDLAKELQAVMIRHRNIGYDWNLTDAQHERLDQYDTATILLAECLQLAAVSNRKAIEESLLLPPGEWSLVSTDASRNG